MSYHYNELLQKLLEVFPDRLPTYHEYSPELVLQKMGQQEVIRFIKRYIEENN